MQKLSVPLEVTRAAQRGLDAYRDNPMSDTSGVTVARHLVTGWATPSVVTHCQRFFTSTTGAYNEESELLRSEVDSSVVQSWLLHGAEAGQAWASQQEGIADPIEELLKLPPEAVQDELTDSAWRGEYGFTPDTAAEFLEQYEKEIDTDKAFGSGAAAVRNSLLRRQAPEDSYSVLCHRLAVRDPEVHTSAEKDLADLTESLDESLKPATFTTVGPLVAAKFVWPTVFAYFILAVADRRALRQYNKHKRPPALFDKPLKIYTSYADPVNAVQCYFHPGGKRYKDPTGTKYEGVDLQMTGLLQRIYKGQYLNKQAVQKILLQTRLWLSSNKLSGTIFYSLLTAWKKGDWQFILDLVPAAADIQPLFAEFVSKGGAEKDDAELQQIAGEGLDPAVKKLLNFHWSGWKEVPLSETLFGKACVEEGMSVGINSVLHSNASNTDKVVKGAFEVGQGEADPFIVIVTQGTEPGETPAYMMDESAEELVKAGTLKVVQKHVDLPGTKAKSDQAPPAEPPETAVGAASPNEEVEAFVQKEVPGAVVTPWIDTVSAKAAKKKYAKILQTGSKLSGESGDSFTAEAAYKDYKKNKYIVLRTDSGKLELLADSDLAVSLKDGDAWFTDVPPASQGAGGKFATAEEYFDAAYADTIKQWKPFDLKNTDAAAAFLEKYELLLTVGDYLKQGTDAFRIEACKYNVYSQVTLIVYRTDTNKFNEIEDSLLTKAIKNGKVLSVTSAYAGDKFPALPAGPVAKAPIVVQAKPAPVTDIEKALDASGYEWSEWIPFESTLTGAAYTQKTGKVLLSLQAFKDTEGGNCSFRAAYQQHSPLSVVIVVTRSDGSIGLNSDVGAANLIKNGSWTLPDALPVDTVSKPVDASSIPTIGMPGMGKLWSVELAAVWKFTALDPFVDAFKKQYPKNVHVWAADANGAVEKAIDAVIVQSHVNTLIPNEISKLAVTGLAPAVPGSITTPAESVERKYRAGDILQTPGDLYKYIVLAASASEYLLYSPAVAGLNSPYKYVEIVSAQTLEKNKAWKFSAGPAVPVITSVLSVTYLGSVTQVPPPVEWHLALQQSVQIGSNSFLFAGAVNTGDVTKDNAILGVFAYPTAYTWQGKNYLYFKLVSKHPSEFANLATPTYKPIDPVPEPASVGALDVPDPQTGNPEMSGTQEALDWLAKKGWLPATKSESPLFKWDLGAKLIYGSVPVTRTILGYGFSADAGTPVYVIQTQINHINYKTAAPGNTKYGPVLEMVQAVINALKPKPGDAEKQKFPKVDYAIGPAAKTLASAHGFTYVSAPGDAPFFVGTTITDPGGTKGKLVGWIKNKFNNNQLSAVVSITGDPGYQLLPKAVLETWTTDYKHGNLIDDETWEVTFGKGPTALPVKVTPNDTNGGPSLPSGIFEGWDHPSPIKQPAMSQLVPGKHVSAGIVAIVPPHMKFAVGPSSKPVEFDYPLLVMVHPMNDFGGYTLTFPKGTVEPGESIEVTAVRECFEETGLHIVPVAHLGDYMGDTSISRMFIGYVKNGNPKKAGAETDSVTFKGLDIHGGAFLKTAWYKSLHVRDKKIAYAAALWYTVHGNPADYALEVADSYSQVTGPQDVKAAVSTPIPADAQKDAVWNAFVENAPFPVSNAMLSKLKSVVLAMFPNPISVDGNEGGSGMPKWGDLFSYKGSPGWMCVGYAIAAGPVSSPVIFCLATNQFMEPFVANASASESQFFVVNAATTAAVKYQAAFFPVTQEPEASAINAYFQDGASTEPNLATVQNFLQLAGVPYWDGLTENMIPKAMGLLYPGVLSGVQKELILAALEKNANELSQPSIDTVSIKPPTGTTSSLATSAYTKTIGAPADGLLWKVSPLPGLITEPAAATAIHKAKEVMQGGAWLVYSPTSVSAKDKVSAWLATMHLDISSGYFVAELVTAPVTAKKPEFVPKGSPLLDPDLLAGGPVQWLVFPDTDYKLAWPTDFAKAVAAFPNGVIVGVAGSSIKSKILSTVAAKFGINKSVLWLVPFSDSGFPTTHTPSAAPSTASSVMPTPLPQPVYAIQMGSPFSGQWKHIATNLDPAAFKILKVPTKQGGNSKTYVLEGPNSSKWFAKEPNDKNPARPAADEAAYRMLEKLIPDSLPVGMMEFGGKLISVQPFLDDLDSDPIPSDPNSLSNENKIRLLRQHVADMFVGDHDAHAGNIFKRNGKLLFVDKGQAFKFYAHGSAQSLDPTFNPPGNVGENYPKKLLIEWSAGKATIPQSAFAGMRQTIAAVQELTDSEIADALARYCEKAGISGEAKDKFFNAIHTARDNYLKDWTTVLKGLRSDFQWPDTPVIPKAKYEASPHALGFKPQHEQIIAEAAASGWQGKSISIDGPVIEGQQVMVRRVLMQTASGQVPATLIHFRIGRTYGKLIAANLFAQAAISTNGVSSDLYKPHVLALDVQKGFWDKIRKAIGNLNYHLFVVKDMKLNMLTISNAMACREELKAIQATTATKTGTYNGEDANEVNKMTNFYLNYLDIIQYAVDHPTEFKDTATAQLFQFTAAPLPIPENETDLAKPKPPFQVLGHLIAGATKPAALPFSTTGNQIVFSGVGLQGSELYSGPNQSQLHVADDSVDAHVFFNSPDGVTGLKNGVEGHKGVGYGIMPGEPSPQTVARLLALFGKASGYNLNASTPEDREAAYWSHQAADLQGGGDFMPTSEGEALADPAYKEALKVYQSGKPDAAVKAFKVFVAEKLGVGVDKLTKLAGYNPDGVWDSGAGWNRFMRLGWTRARLKQVLGDDVYVVHAPYINIDDLFVQLGANGALLSNNTKPFYGVPVGSGYGVSVGSDFDAGGTQGLFCGLRKGFTAQKGVLYFDISLLLRTDVYIVAGDTTREQDNEKFASGHSVGVADWDSYGKVTHRRITNPALFPEIFDKYSFKWTGSVGATTKPQISVRHDIDLRTYLWRATGDYEQIQKMKQCCAAYGWTTFAQGRTVEQVFGQG